MTVSNDRTNAFYLEGRALAFLNTIRNACGYFFGSDTDRRKSMLLGVGQSKWNKILNFDSVPGLLSDSSRLIAAAVESRVAGVPTWESVGRTARYPEFGKDERSIGMDSSILLFSIAALTHAADQLRLELGQGSCKWLSRCLNFGIDSTKLVARSRLISESPQS